MPPSPRASQSPGGAYHIPPGWRSSPIQIEAHGQGSPREAVALAQGLRDPPLGSQERPAGVARAGPGDCRPPGCPRAVLHRERRIRHLGPRARPGHVQPHERHHRTGRRRHRPITGEPGCGLLARLPHAAAGAAAGGRRAADLAVWRERGARTDLPRRFARARRLCGDQHLPLRQSRLHQHRAVPGRLPGPDPLRRAPGRTRCRALVVRRHDRGLPHPLPRPRADLGRLARGAAQQLGRRRPTRRRERVRDLDARRVGRGGRLRPRARARLAVVGQPPGPASARLSGGTDAGRRVRGRAPGAGRHAPRALRLRKHDPGLAQTADWPSSRG